ncbi:hypothetical protein CW749_22440 [Vibrio sp. vnigr-6D03]|uniref:hypothetical protein n=1 Tax=Vibrio sp. vnigr-6D03 TaxID=2058088 RepID=UPI000C31F2DF|nr:hypothetical protein [Vibrio sp. vnigr-6D03]PKF77313.1 hypothetical protein CW749_22440 [Vibrio sp. vnigr-6D03]
MSTYIKVHSIYRCKQCASDSAFCESTLDDEPQYFVVCDDCGFEGEECISAPAAIDAWNRSCGEVG